MTDDISGLSFEDALAELERIVRGLETGQQKLEDATDSYERGAALRRHFRTDAESIATAVVAQLAHAGELPPDAAAKAVAAAGGAA